MPDSSTDPSSSVCELTPAGRGAICVLQVNALRVRKRIGEFFKPATGDLTTRKAGRPIFGTWRSAKEDAFEELVVCIRSEQCLEVQCHGGQLSKTRILRDLASIGFSVVPWRELTTPHSAADHARRLLPEALTEKGAAVLLSQVDGALDSEISEIASDIDQDRIELARRRVEKLIQSSATGLHCVTPWKIAIAGPPNVGKSSLMNRFLGFDRSIVCEIAGTTRDLLVGRTAIDGWPFEFTDTAGLRESIQEVELEGIRRARGALQNADLVLWVVDARGPLSDVEDGVELRRRVVIANKSDLLDAPLTARPDGAKSDRVLVSAKTSAGIRELLDSLVRQLVPIEPCRGQPMAFLSHQVTELDATATHLALGELDKADSALKRATC